MGGSGLKMTKMHYLRAKGQQFCRFARFFFSKYPYSIANWKPELQNWSYIKRTKLRLYLSINKSHLKFAI